ncbi:MAG TPA: hypothetical protein VIX17_01515 [Pyrinomonadaceae bacterium]|jgi:hypothetical protein
MDQVYQVSALMEAIGAVKDGAGDPCATEEVLGARRRKQAGIYDSEEPPRQEISETLFVLFRLCC